MKQFRLLTLLALLMTAATGAWAQDAKHLITATYDEQTRSLEQPLPYATTIGELYEAVTEVIGFLYLVEEVCQLLVHIAISTPALVDFIDQLSDGLSGVTIEVVNFNLNLLAVLVNNSDDGHNDSALFIGSDVITNNDALELNLILHHVGKLHLHAVDDT